MNNIDEIMALIDWARSDEEQKRGIEMAREVQCIRAFFQPSGPGYCKSVWGNCAHILCERQDADLIPYVLEMLMWLQDLNWPGAEQILARLHRFEDVAILSETIAEMIPALVAIGEDAWLASIAQLLIHQKLADSLDEDTKRVLAKYACHNCQ